MTGLCWQMGRTLNKFKKCGWRSETPRVCCCTCVEPACKIWGPCDLGQGQNRGQRSHSQCRQYSRRRKGRSDRFELALIRTGSKSTCRLMPPLLLMSKVTAWNVTKLQRSKVTLSCRTVPFTAQRKVWPLWAWCHFNRLGEQMQMDASGLTKCQRLRLKM